MKKIISLQFYFYIILFVTSCNDIGKNINPLFNTKRTKTAHLNYIKEISFDLDSQTTNIFTASQYIPNENIYSFMSLDKNILFYDYDTNKLLYKIPLSLPQPTTYQYINKDTIILLDYSTEELIIINNKSEVINSYKIKHNIEYYPSPITKIAPITFINNCIYVFGNMAGEYNNENNKNRNVLLKYNCLNNTKSYHIPYPDIYKKNWNGTLFRWCYADYTPLHDSFLISFPADHYIYSYDYKQDSITKFYAGSEHIESTFYIKKPKQEFINADDRTKHFVESDSYSTIIYDQYQNIYYRFAELNSIYEGIPGWSKELSIIILDSEFNIIGETFIGKVPTTYRYATFITKEGLHLPHFINENILNFSIYQLKRN